MPMVPSWALEGASREVVTPPTPEGGGAAAAGQGSREFSCFIIGKYLLGADTAVKKRPS